MSGSHLGHKIKENPRHIAIIMDGNGRWASARGLSRVKGHKQGAEAVRKMIKAASEMEIPYITLFGFSSENWKRPDQEVSDLMSLLRFYLKRETAELQKSGVCLRVIGERSRLAKDIVALIENAEKITADNTKLNVTIALSYGGRQEIVMAAQKFAAQVIENPKLLEDLNEEKFESFLMTAGLPDPDLLIRTSGEKRISNFLLWQCAYSELYFTDTYWPDFDKTTLQEAVNYFKGCERRFGSLPVSG